MGIFSRIFGSGRSRDATIPILLDQYGRFKDLDESGRLMKLFTPREAWQGVHEATLREVIRRLDFDGDGPEWHLHEVIRFIILAEDCEKHARRGGAIAN